MIHDDCVVRIPDAKRIRLPRVVPTLSLHDMLRKDSHRLLPYHKVILALNLSHGLSRMYHGDMSTGWTSEDIFFLFNQDDCAINQAYNPFVPGSLSQQTPRRDSELAETRKFSLLVAFGKLLIEIALERILEESELCISREDVALLTIIDSPEEAIAEKVPVGYVDAIEACLQANQDDDYDEESDDDEKPDEEHQIREVLASVVESLEDSRAAFRQKAGFNNPNFPKDLKVSRNLLRQTLSPRSKPQKLHGANPLWATNIAANDGSVESASQLFDGRRHSIKSADK
ncbi:hypothetical protein CSPX01_03738 [Colletotrichum filicis]|nr:hypothetical protein CSPX01_03738 [Colletotrichum filicis]